MLRACRRVLRRGGRLAFFVIEPAAGLSGAARRRAHAVGPPAVAVRTGYPSLLRSAGFERISITDVTEEYRITQRAWQDASRRREGALRAAIGDDVYEDEVARRRRTRRAIDDGLLARTLYTAVR